MKKKGKIEEIVSYRERNEETHRLIPRWRPSDLRRSLDTLPEELDKELLKYYPVALVNAMEVYFKGCIGEIINFNTEFSERAEPLARGVKIDYEMIHALQGKSVTLGEIIAHSVPVGSYASIASAMSSILGFDFSNKLSVVHSRWSVEVMGEPLKPILNDSKENIQIIQEIFTARHIIAHEMPANFNLDRETIKTYISHTELFLIASEQIVSETLHPGAPLTQLEMTMNEISSFERESKELKRVIDGATQILMSINELDYLEKLKKSQSLWEELRHLDAELEADEAFGGSMWPMLYHGSLSKLTKQRLQFIRSLFVFDRKLFNNE